MGVAFAEHLTQYAKSKDIKLGHITKIEQNPDQSKHLETATLKVFGQDIDLVNLRSEEYVEDSRIPKQVVCRFFVFRSTMSLIIFIEIWDTSGGFCPA
jgi:tRNA nucleotidyltransferase (CCA-adding enzyme)